jgi:hypothetical protein
MNPVVEATAPVAVAGIVEALWAPPRENVYVVLDGARDDRIGSMVRDSGDSYRCLYEGNIPRELEEVAPWLVRLDPEYPFARELIREGWGKSWGVFLRSPADIEEMRRHLRRFLRVKTEQGKTLVFRYYDPRVLRVYLPTCTADELATFFGPVTSYAMEGTDRDVLDLVARDGAGFSFRRYRFDGARPGAA